MPIVSSDFIRPPEENEMKKRLLAASIAAAVMGVAAAPQAEVAPPSAAVAIFLAGVPVCGFATPLADGRGRDRCDHLLPSPAPLPNPLALGASAFRAVSAL